MSSEFVDPPPEMLCPCCEQMHAADVLFCPATGEPIAVSWVKSGDIIADKYRAIRKIGTGGMGTIWEVEHIGLGKRLALKLLSPELADQETATRRFEQEARAASAIGHPGIIHVTDVGATEAGVRYIAMELLDGEDLGSIIAQGGPLDLKRAVHLVGEILQGLEAAHAADIIHRDLKPENVFICQGPDGEESVKLLDFGISKIAGSDEAKLSLTKTGLIVGTPYYMSPEQARASKDIDHRADLYSVGVVLYQSLTGERPIAEDNLNSLLFRIITGEISWAAVEVDAIPDQLLRVMRKALATEPDQRFGSAAEFRQALNGEVSLDPPEESDIGETAVADRSRIAFSAPTPAGTQPRSRWVALLVTLAVLVTVVGVGLLVPSYRSSATKQRKSSSPQAMAVPQPELDGSVRKSRSAGPPPVERNTRVTITVTTSPEEAKVSLDGQPLGSKTLRLERSKREHWIEVTAHGFRPRKVAFRANETQRLEVVLKPKPDARSKTRHRRKRPFMAPPAATRAPPGAEPMRKDILFTTDI